MKKEIEKASAQKQECGCPSLQPSLHSHTQLVPDTFGMLFLVNPPALCKDFSISTGNQTKQNNYKV